MLPTGTVTIRYNLRTSRDAVTTVRVLSWGLGVVDVTGADLRPFATVEWSAPLAPGTYPLQLVAQTAAGCSVSSGPMAVMVAP